MHTWKRLPLALLLFAGAAFLAALSLRYAWATWLASEDTMLSLRHAVALAPENAEWRGRLAVLEPENSEFWLDSALNLDPNATVLRIERGVNEEVAGNIAAAEADFLEAARRDHQYVPRWTLAAFYFRQHDQPKFQIWARQALEMAYGDALPLFQMAAQLGMSVDDIRRFLLPGRAPVFQAFLFHCLTIANFAEAGRAAHRLLEIGSASHDRDAAIGAVGALFRAGLIDEAVAIWNQAAAAHWIPNLALNRQSGPLVSNPEFSFEFLPAGFDWNQNAVEGVAFWRLGTGRGFQVELSSHQPESCTLATLPLPLAPGRPYALHIAEATEIPPGSGLSWRLLNHEWDAAKEVDDKFDAPAKPQPLWLSLVYNRALGTRRTEGTLTISRVTVGPAQ